jgi:hypothetical protein
MKLNHLFQPRHRRQIVRHFGDASLVRYSNGQHELIGGTNADRQAAFEWVSLFAHEIVFTHFYREAGGRCRNKLFAPGLPLAC